MFTFAAAVFFLIVTPGPGVLSAAGVGAAYGFRAGLRYVLGLFIGNNLVVIAVVSGLAALLLASPRSGWAPLCSGLTCRNEPIGRSISRWPHRCWSSWHWPRCPRFEERLGKNPLRV